MGSIAFLVNPDRPAARDLAAATEKILVAGGHQVRVLTLDGPDGVIEDGRHLALGSVDLSGSDVAVSLGGDGTFLHLVPRAWAAGIPVVGVDFGRLGYLLEVAPDGLRPVLESVLRGEATVEDRAALLVTVDTAPQGASPAPGPERAAARRVPPSLREPRRDGEGDGPGTDSPIFALNEVVLEKTVFGHTVRLATAVDGAALFSYSADGLLVATPTGSTAYNLSAGGPVLAPRLRAYVVTPVAPHLAFDRSLVLDPTQVLEVTVQQGPDAALVVDGREAGRLPPGSVVTCRLADRPVRLVTLGRRRLGEVLATALPDGRG